ncbi:MAG: HtrA2 peptidase [Microgenomates group bacterium GW2011_GWA2_44_7]|nr:MAG: HtrA2 peptidase [Microgenomates group bacterium GW2011_GWA2_44_7]KKT77303.1 MAG: HtrA2 peptidase [Microgenomates group bacterium GW2011_GWB1_44_8]
MVLVIALFGPTVSDRLKNLRVLDRIIGSGNISLPGSQGTVRVIGEESVTIDVFKKVSPSVVTVAIQPSAQQRSSCDPFDPFCLYSPPSFNRRPSQPQNIGTGFMVSNDGMLVTNKHVVSEENAKYQVITSDNKKYDVVRIFRDPANDIAILKIDSSGLSPVEMGDSSNLVVGQMAIAIGTPLGEFRNTLTRGVISGLGRGIQAGDPFQGYVERLDNVIQTDAAINPGNSGGPLVNSAGQVIGINVAVAQSGQNIGFAIPINVVKESLDNFNKTGKFMRPFLGVQYRVIDRRTAILNDLPEGVYVDEVVGSSPADKAGIQDGDIIVKINGQTLRGENDSLTKIINNNKVGDVLEMEIWRDEQTLKLRATLAEAQ